MLQLIIQSGEKSTNAAPFCPSIRWSGEYRQAARTLSFSLLSSSTDPTIPTIDCPLGASVKLIVGGDVLFDGYIISRTKSTEGNTIDMTCYDRGFYLKRNKAMYKFTAQTPEAIAAQLCTDFGITLGYAAPTGVAISRIFYGGSDTLYSIMQTAYTLAAKTTGKAYHIGFRGDKLYITVKEPDHRTLILQGGSNLITASTTESIENAVTTVQIYSADDTLIRTVEDAERKKLYGRLQEIVKQSKDDDKASEAQKLLDNGGVEQKITVNSLGNIANVTGGTVVVQEPYTGIYGLFYIDSDTHEWKRGQYYNKLTLNFKAIMDEKEAGSLPNATGSKTGGNQVANGYVWTYDYYGNVREGENTDG